MKSQFQKLVQEASPSRQKPSVLTGGLFVGMSTAPEVWGQKDSRFKPVVEPQGDRAEQPEAEVSVVDEEQIRSELNLSDHLTIPELQSIRRSFARQNHPDTRPEEFSLREERMKIANMIIDQQIELRLQG